MMHNKMLQDRIGRLKEWEQPVNSDKLREILELNEDILAKAEEKNLNIKTILEAIQWFLEESELEGNLIVNDMLPLNEILYSAFESIDAYVDEQLNDLANRIKDERVFTKEHFENMLNEISINRRPGAERLNQMAKNIMSQAPFCEESPVIKTAVCTFENLYKQKFLYPVSMEPPITSKAPGYITKIPSYVATAFAECDYITIQEIMKGTFEAEITTKDGVYKTQVTLRYSEKYLQKLEGLYNCFNANELPWVTVNGIYFYKFLDIHAATAIYEEIEGFVIDFGDFKDYLTFDKILLWNIEKKTAAVSAYEVKPAFNAVQYEFSLEKLEFLENRYLICSVFDKFSCFRRGNTMFLRTYKKQLEQIELLRITNSETKDLLLYLPYKTNRKKRSAANLLATGRFVPTRAEAEKIINSLKPEADLELTDVKIIPLKDDIPHKTIDYNYFMNVNEFLPDRRLLLFSFKVNTEPIWAYETMFFVLSELQMYFYEFRCVGEIV